FPSRRSRSASPAPPTPRCSPPRSSPTSIPRSPHRSNAIAPSRRPKCSRSPIRGTRDETRSRAAGSSMTRPRVGIVGGGQLGRMLALAKLADLVDVMTLEIENVAVPALESLDGHIDVFPPPAAVAAAQDRLAEKYLFRSLGIPTAEFVTIDSEADAASAEVLGWPAILKTRRMGYDGRGQRVVDSAAALATAWRDLGGVASI